VTTARLTVRNSRRQFLRLALPPKSQVWSVFVDGKPEKPAYASGGDGDGTAILIRMINSSEGFPVDIVYATPVEGMGELGTVTSRLPRPDMVVTHTRWDVFLPVGPRYQEPDSTMDVVGGGAWVNPRIVGVDEVMRAAYQTQMGQPLRITVPTQGVRFSFEKLYANQSPEDAAFSIRYVSGGIDKAALFASAAGAILLWIGIVAIGGRRLRLSRGMTVAAIASGAALLVASIGYFGTSPIPASGMALAIAVLLAAWSGVERLRDWRAARAA